MMIDNPLCDMGSPFELQTRYYFDFRNFGFVYINSKNTFLVLVPSSLNNCCTINCVYRSRMVSLYQCVPTIMLIRTASTEACTGSINNTRLLLIRPTSYIFLIHLTIQIYLISSSSLKLFIIESYTLLY